RAASMIRWRLSSASRRSGRGTEAVAEVGAGAGAAVEAEAAIVSIASQCTSQTRQPERYSPLPCFGSRKPSFYSVSTGLRHTSVRIARFACDFRVLAPAPAPVFV